jgi:DNA processing protein
VSGLAQGIDQVAHRAALDAGGVTLAVFGSGINRVYPAQHRALAKEILQQGGLHISEFPPGAPPAKHHFVKRNRIISGLSRACLLGQSARKGGSMITQSYVKEQGRDFYAIPYAPSEPQSGGSLYALRDGASLTRSANDILSESYQEIPLESDATTADSTHATTPTLTLLQSEILSRCHSTPISIDVLMQAMPNQRSEVLYALVELEWLQHIKRLPGDQYIRLE